jgi:hypothetical protein
MDMRRMREIAERKAGNDQVELARISHAILEHQSAD